MAKQPFGRRGWTPDLLGPIAGKTFVITGANSGTGFQAARGFLERGAKVVMLNRSKAKTEVALQDLREEFGQDADIQFIQMDLGSLASVRAASAEVLSAVVKIDALICNAAIAQVPSQQLTEDGFESQLGVNHFGHFLLTGLLFERIALSAGRIVVVGSGAYRMGQKRIQFEDLNFDRNYTAWNSYAQSKLAQMMFGFELQRRVLRAGSGVEVHVCHPGASRTSLIDTSGGLFTRILWSALSRFIAQSAEKGAWPEIMCAAQNGLQPQTLYGPTRRNETVGPVGPCRLHPCALDEEAAQRLWAISEEKTACRWEV